MSDGGMGLGNFIWGPGGQRLSADEVARRRALASSLIPQQAPRDYWSGINSIVGNIGGALHNWQADQAETAGRSEYEGMLAQALESGATDIASLAPLLTHDFASSGGSALGQALLGRGFAAEDRADQRSYNASVLADQRAYDAPYRDAQLQGATLGNQMTQAQLDATLNPFQAMPATPEQLAQWGITPQPNESWTIGPDGLPQQVYAPPGVTGDPFTLSPGEVRFGPDGQPIASVESGGASLSENERQIAALVERGFSEAEAQDLAYGFIQTIVDPVLQTPMIVNRTTGEGRYITPEEAAALDEVVPGSVAPDEGAPSPQFDATFGEVEGATDSALQQTMEAQRPTLWGISESSTGIIPWMQENWTSIAGQAGAGGFEDVVENRQMFDIEKNNLIRALSINPRFPVGEMERLEREINITPGVWNSANSMRARMIAINDALSTRLDNETRVANDPSMPAEARRNALQAANDIRNFLTTLGVPEGANAATGRGAGDPSPEARPPLETFMRQ